MKVTLIAGASIMGDLPDVSKNNKEYGNPSIDFLSEKEIKGLFVYARKKLLVVQQYGHLSHLTYEDIVHTAFEKALSGERRWNPNNCSVYIYFLGVIRSITSNEVVVSKNRQEYTNTCAEDSISSIYPSSPEMEELLISLEEVESIIALIRSKKPALLPLVKTMIQEGTVKPRILAELLNKPITMVYNEKKQVVRLCKEYIRGNT